MIDLARTAAQAQAGGWQLILHLHGTTEARSPDGKQVLRSHAPPAD